METISANAKYFLTPSNNIVRGVLDAGKITEAEFYVNKKNEYTSPSQLNHLMKERNNLALGKIELKEISRPNFSDYNIPVDAGKPKKPKKSKKQSLVGGQVDANVETEMEAGGKSGKKKKPRKVMAGKGSGASTKSSTSKTSKKSKKSKKSDIVIGGAPNQDEKRTTLADLFKQVSLHLAHQTSDLIAKGGDPAQLLKSDIKFFSKQ